MTSLHGGDTVLMPQVHMRIPHLWIIATEPLLAGESILVNVTAFRGHSDNTLVLNKGDHPFIYKQSVIAGIDNGHWPQREPCSQSLLDRIRLGILASPRTPPKVKTFYRALASAPFGSATAAE